jgi:translation initiation factor IF-2
MSKKRNFTRNNKNTSIREIASEAAINVKDVIAKGKEVLNRDLKHNSKVTPEEAGKIFDAIKKSPKTTETNTSMKTQKGNVKVRNNKHHQTQNKSETSENTNQDKRTSSEENLKNNRNDRKEPRKSQMKIIKRKGIKIVKKKRPKKDDEKRTTIYGKISQEAQRELTSKKGSKKGQQVAKKKKQGEELDIFHKKLDDNKFHAKDMNEPEEIVLLDYRDQTLLIDEDEAREEAAALARKNAALKKANKTGQGRNSKAKKTKQALSKNVKKRKKKIRENNDEVITQVEIPENIRVYEFADKIKRPLSEVIKILFGLGMMVTKNDFLDKEVIEVLAEEFEIEVTTIDVTEEFDYVKDYEKSLNEDENIIERAPIITIMGHVDHGKTSLLDKIRLSKIAEREAGGITQHIGAYTISHNEKQITFIDTPGHSAFSEMRKRGANITDIVIIVVAADDGVKPQTKEAIKYALEAKVPIIVAINKIDKEGTNIDMVKSQMAENNLTPTDWGGDIDFVLVSAKTGEGIDELLENIQIQAELLELRANPEKRARAVVIESALEKGRGAVATVIVKNGTLKVGDSIVVNQHYGKVKTLLNDQKKTIKQILPGETGVVVGLSGIPASGTDLVVTENEKKARELAEKWAEYERNKVLSKTTKASFDELGTMIAEGKLNTLKIILKSDTHGTLEAIKTSLEALRNDEVKVSIIRDGVGGITESDIDLATDSDNIIIVGFNVRPTGSVKTLADRRGIKLKTYSVIYDILDDVTNILTGMMKPIEEEINTGQVEIKQLFKVKDGIVAGCFVIDGIVEKGIFARLIRNGVVIGDTTIINIKRFKEDVTEVKKGYECGILLKDRDNIKEGDIIETYKKVEKQAQL